MLTLAGQLSKNEFSVYEVKCYFYVDEKTRTIYGWEEQNDETRRTTLCGCSVYEVKCYLLQGFHRDFTLACPVLVKKQCCFESCSFACIFILICLYVIIICFQILTKMLLIVKRSKYIKVRSYFKVFVEANAAVQSDLNFVAQF